MLLTLVFVVEAKRSHQVFIGEANNSSSDERGLTAHFPNKSVCGLNIVPTDQCFFFFPLCWCRCQCGKPNPWAGFMFKPHRTYFEVHEFMPLIRRSLESHTALFTIFPLRCDSGHCRDTQLPFILLIIHDYCDCCDRLKCSCPLQTLSSILSWLGLLVILVACIIVFAIPLSLFLLDLSTVGLGVLFWVLHRCTNRNKCLYITKGSTDRMHEGVTNMEKHLTLRFPSNLQSFSASFNSVFWYCGPQTHCCRLHCSHQCYFQQWSPNEPAVNQIPCTK